jgi:sec-independent protein translocase protein TatC
MENVKFSFFSHLEELRWIIIKSFAAVFFSSCLLYNLSPQIIDFLIKPIGKAVFLSPMEAFTVYLNLSFVCGFVAVLPYILYLMWRFISPALELKISRPILLLSCFSFFLFLGGCLFGYFVILPMALKFFLSFVSSRLAAMISLQNYISFITGFTLSFGLAFQLPLVIMVLCRLGIFKIQDLKSNRRWAIVIVLILAALLSPVPEVASQLLLAGPMYALYELSIIISSVSIKR